jgi:hypothetical protein
VAGRRRECTRIGSDLEWVGLGQTRLGAKGTVLNSVKLRDVGESGGLAVGLGMKRDDVRLFEPASARGEDFRGA